MSKKLIISLSVVLGFVAVLLILFWTLFALRGVEVQFHTSTQNITVSQKEIADAAGFRYGASVLFEGKKKYVDNLERMATKNANFAYLKVLNIETKFPNKYVIHVAEREEVFAVQTYNQYLICDKEFRVLRVLDNFKNTQSNAIVLKGLKFADTANVGDFLDIQQKGMLKFYSSFVANNRNLALMQGKFKSITLGKNEDTFTKQQFDCITLESFTGRKYIINNIDFALTAKVQKLFAAESALFAQTVEDGTGNIVASVNQDGSKNYVWVTKTEDGMLLSAKPTDAGAMPLTINMLSNCAIVVDNLTLSENVNRTEKDVYYALKEI